MPPQSDAGDTPLVSVVLPAYNEEASIGADLQAIIEAMDRSGYSYEIIVVDDGSTDRTAHIAASFPNVHVVRHDRNRGTGAARSTGMRLARGRIVAMSDADGTYPNHELPKLVEGVLKGADMVVGARRVEAGTWPWLRVPAKEFIRYLASYLTNMPIPDLNSGFRAIRRDVALRFLPILPATHSWVSTITLALLTNGYRVDYIPIDYYPRKGGRSSFHPVRDTYNYLSLVLRTITYFNPLKIFLPVSLLMGTAGLVKTIFDLTVHSRFRESDVLILVVAVLIGMMGLLADLIVTHGRFRYLPDEPHIVQDVRPAPSVTAEESPSVPSGSDEVPSRVEEADRVPG